MKDFAGIALIAVGGYILYEWLMGASTLAQGSATQGTSTTSNTSNTSDNQVQGKNSAGGNNQPVATVADLKAQLLNAALANGSFTTNTLPAAAGGTTVPVGTYWQWNYIFEQVTGIPQTASPIGDPKTVMDVNGYINMRGANGLSGLDVFNRGMGRVWVSGYGGMGKIGRGYGINQLAINSDATAYELAAKYSY